MRSHHLSFRIIFEWVNKLLAGFVKPYTMCILLQNFLLRSLRARKVKQGRSKYSTHFKMFQINFFGVIKQCIFQLYLCGAAASFLGIPDFLPCMWGQKKCLILCKTHQLNGGK